MMKKYFYALSLVLCSVALTSCDDEDVIEDPLFDVVDFEGSYWNGMIDTPQYGGTLLYNESYSAEGNTYKWMDASTSLYSELTKMWGGSYGFAEGGVAISNYHDTDMENHATYEYQLAVPFTEPSNNFAMVYIPASVGFSDKKARIIESMDVALSTYTAGVMMYGDFNGVSFTDSDNYVVTITGYNDTTVTGTYNVTFNMANFKSSTQGWTSINLSSLGAVTSLEFSASGTVGSEWGITTPSYIAVDNVKVLR